VTGVRFTDTLPSGLLVATPNGLSNGCGGTVSAVADDSSISLSGGTLPAGSLCEVSVNVLGTWGGEKKNSVAVSSSAGAGNTSTARLTVADPPRGERVYWSNPDGNEVSFTNLDGTGGGDLSNRHRHREQSGWGGARPRRGRIYWANAGRKHDLLRQSRRQRWRQSAHRPSHGCISEGVALDPAAGRIYWANASANKISYAKLDGSGGGDMFTGGTTVSEPEGVALGPAAGRIYWANVFPAKISYAKLDGSGGGDLTTGLAGFDAPVGVALDPAAGRIYWANFEASKISYVDLTAAAGAIWPPGGATVSDPEGNGARPRCRADLLGE